MNQITLKGVIKNIRFSHAINDIEYNKADLVIPRTDGQEDVLDLRFKKFANVAEENSEIEIIGNVRSYSVSNEGKNKVQIYVFTYFDIPETEDINKVELSGRICKIDELRKTQKDKDILHFILANNIITNQNSKKINSYIPCTCYGTLAKRLSECKVNDQLELTGALHSRQYNKTLQNGEIEIRTAYEVVVDSADILA